MTAGRLSIRILISLVFPVRHWQDLGYLIIFVTGRPCMQLQKVVSWLTRHNFPLGLVSFADGFSTDPLGHKTEYLKHLQQEQAIVFHAGYGSSKDISVYSSIGLKPDSIHIVGKLNKKHCLARRLTFLFSVSQAGPHHHLKNACARATYLIWNQPYT